MEPARRETRFDHARGQADREQLQSRDHAVLPAGKGRYRGIDGRRVKLTTYTVVNFTRRSTRRHGRTTMTANA